VPDVSVSRQGRVLVCTFDRGPSINASTPAMIGGWLRALEAAADDDSVGAVVTAAAGRGWCAGADLSFLLRHQGQQLGGRRPLDELGWELIAGDGGDAPPPPSAARFDELGLNAMALFLAEYPKPLIAAIGGAVAGGGFPLALLHDIRFVSTDASFRTSFLELGLVSELGLGYLLPRFVGTGHALDLCLSGRAVRGKELVELGVAERYVDDGVDAAALEYAQVIADRPSEQTAALRKLLRHHSNGDFVDYLRTEWAYQRDAFESTAAAAGVASVASRLGVARA
jgi:2-(1,2-epoxy-1,2-dihydrophenyl)acetyl-CoA isomerase